MAVDVDDAGGDIFLCAVDHDCTGGRVDRLPERDNLAIGEQNLAALDLPALAVGDFLFIDSSHVVSSDSDVDHLIHRVLPALPIGVFVHIHDIFLPDPYPPEWDYRGYNEQVAVAGLLEAGEYDVVFASRYVATRMNVDLAPLPLMEGAFENSLWLRKR